ncbi:Gfo/Idh/MocA family oxidoreductase [Martelella lutilitoris]|uniref:Gfo/Idh/MocA family oxidoreductase n=1 Tax=Martelella lutilitoris TaxID=2583532 RepID=A0A7T7HMU3_9HYPH|nr:Gfo/Idh/MocA family oxidoreductase [Martelella lutilitoris]QQM32085.1 Gfo/Idh/MocA family oxidoreductase [Martelella lutilitoris]
MTLNIGWIGCGRHATHMLMPQLGRNDMRIAAVCDLNRDAAVSAAWQYGAEAVYGDYSELIAHKGLDAICMAVGPDLHRVAAIAALEKGLPVFLEKPPARDAAGAREIAAAAEKAGKPVIVGFMKRYSTGNRIAGNILRGESFGKVLGVTGSYMSGPAYFAGVPDYSGFYLHHCVHYMDLIPWFAGSAFEDMAVRTVETAPGHLLLHLNFTCANGAIGTIVMGTIQSRGTPTEDITIMGDHRRIEIENVINVRYFRDPPFKAEDPAATLAGGADTLSWTPNFTAAANEDHKGYAALMADAAKAFRGEANTAPDITDGVSAMASLERMTALIDDDLRRRRK